MFSKKINVPWTRSYAHMGKGALKLRTSHGFKERVEVIVELNNSE
jgi:hypothetical protein